MCMVVCCVVLVTLAGDLVSSLQCGQRGIYLGDSLCCFGIFHHRPMPGVWWWLWRAGSILALLQLRVSSEQAQTTSAEPQPFSGCKEGCGGTPRAVFLIV